jgi:predicted N-formylglutamate amidohydrolase
MVCQTILPEGFYVPVDGGGVMSDSGRSVVTVENPDGAGSFVIVCDHASNRIPAEYQSFAFFDDALTTHIAWDPGALPVARHLSATLDAPLLWPDVSRLVIDCNRDLGARSLIVTESEGRPVPTNVGLSDDERSRRIELIHTPYHAAIDACLKRRHAAGRPTTLIAIHSYTPVYLGESRPWKIGIVFGEDRRMADLLIGELEADSSLRVGVNQPYSPADQVYYTVERHAGPRGLPAAMIEIRNDEIGDDAGQRRWADRLANILIVAEPRLLGAKHAAA